MRRVSTQDAAHLGQQQDADTNRSVMMSSKLHACMQLLL
jgi:hypothetical protein